MKSPCTRLNVEQLNREHTDRWMISATWEYLQECITCSALCASVLKTTCHLFKPGRFGLHQDVHRKGGCQRYLPGCHSDGESHPWLLLVYRSQGTVLNSYLSVGHEYFLVNEEKGKWITDCNVAAWRFSSLLAVLFNLLVPFHNRPHIFKGREPVNLLNFKGQCLRWLRPTI